MKDHLTITISIDHIDDFGMQSEARAELLYVLGFARGFCSESLRHEMRESAASAVFDSNGNTIGSVSVKRSKALSRLLREQRS